jgi:hypothetical protein
VRVTLPGPTLDGASVNRDLRDDPAAVLGSVPDHPDPLAGRDAKDHDPRRDPIGVLVDLEPPGAGVPPGDHAVGDEVWRISHGDGRVYGASTGPRGARPVGLSEVRAQTDVASGSPRAQVGQSAPLCPMW